MSAQVNHGWKHRLISASGVISDAWDVFIAWAGRGASWILFACLVISILQVIPNMNVPEILKNITLGVEIITLDIAGFGLNSLASHIRKYGGRDAQATAGQGANLGKFLIGLMMVTVVLITAATIWPTLKSGIDVTDKILILVRMIAIILYMHTVKELRHVELEIETKEVQTAQANDQLTLQVATKLDQLTGIVDGLQKQFGSLSTNQQQLCTQVADVSTKYTDLDGLYTNLYTDRNDGVDMDVYTARLDKLEKMFNGLNVSVTNINNNVQTMTQNVGHNIVSAQMYTPAQKPDYSGFTGPMVPKTEPHSVVNATKVTDVTNEVVRNTVSLPERADTKKSAQALVPVLDVVGVNPDKVAEVLAAYLSGTQWRDCPANYSRVTKKVREAYEAYLADGVHTAVDA